MKADKILNELMNGLETAESYNDCFRPDKDFKFSFVVSRKVAQELFIKRSVKPTNL